MPHVIHFLQLGIRVPFEDRLTNSIRRTPGSRSPMMVSTETVDPRAWLRKSVNVQARIYASRPSGFVERKLISRRLSSHRGIASSASIHIDEFAPSFRVSNCSKEQATHAAASEPAATLSPGSTTPATARFEVPAEFRRLFRIESERRTLKKNALLMLAFQTYVSFWERQVT
jgi:hypothetical protein